MKVDRKAGLEQRWYENGDLKYEVNRESSGLKNDLETILFSRWGN